RLFGIEHHARFSPSSEPSPVLRRVQKLLALAESTNLHEAEAAMTKAQALMAHYELDEGLRDTEFRYLYLGAPERRKSLVRQLIASLLVRFFQVEAVWLPTLQLVSAK